MANLKLKDISFQFPSSIDFTESDFINWLEYQLEANPEIKDNNPLKNLTLKECLVNVGSANIDGTDIDMGSFKYKNE